MKNMKVAKKLQVAFMIMIVLALAIGITGILGMFSLNNAATGLYESNLIAIKAMGNLREIFVNERNDLRNIFLNKEDPAVVKSYMDKFADYEKSATENFALYETTITDESAENDYYTAKNTWLNEFNNLKTSMWASINAGDFDTAYSDFNAASPIVAPIVNGLASSSSQNDKWAMETNDDTDALYLQLTILLVAILVVAVISAAVLGLYISRLISKPLVMLTQFMQIAGSTGDITLRPEDIEVINSVAHNKDETGMCISSTLSFVKHVTAIAEELGVLANGDLTVKIEVLSDKDVMGVAVKKMVDNLNGMFGEINASTEQVSTVSKQIANGAQSLAQGSTEQAAAVEELSSSIAEIAVKTKTNADMAGKAADLANTIMDSAQKGSVQMDEMMSAVKDINHASQNISRVIKVIEDIAFKTNILALNAAVEAARAGQHGKGFTVVAEEVRNLAAQSTEAAKDTGVLIANSMEKAELGARIADETAASLAEIVSRIGESSQLVGGIAQSSEEQSNSISQINKGIDQVAQVIQQNSATAEQSAAASQEMSGQASMLESLISQFKLIEETGRGFRNASIQQKAPAKQLPANSVYTSESNSFGKY